MRKLFPLFLTVALVVPASFPGLPILGRGATERFSSAPQQPCSLRRPK